MIITLVVDKYTGEFFITNKHRKRKKIGRVGNARVALDLIPMLKKLGHKVKVEEISDEVD